jgi:hypothetical protein
MIFIHTHIFPKQRVGPFMMVRIMQSRIIILQKINDGMIKMSPKPAKVESISVTQEPFHIR